MDKMKEKNLLEFKNKLFAGMGTSTKPPTSAADSAQ
jgi:hypothetical protein